MADPTPVITILIQSPPPQSFSVVDAPIRVTGVVSWTPPTKSLVQSMTIQLVDPSGAGIDSANAEVSNKTDSGFAWSASLESSEMVERVLIFAIAIDAHGGEVGRRMLEHSIQPEVILEILHPASKQTFGIGAPIAINGTVAWNPHKPGYVRGIRVTALGRANEDEIASKSIDLPVTAAGTRSWETDLPIETVVDNGVMRVIAVNSAGNPLNQVDIGFTVKKPETELKISSPLQDQAFVVKEQIPVSGSVKWAPESAGFIRVIRLDLVQKVGEKKEVVVASTVATLTNETERSAAWAGTLPCDDHIQLARIRALALDKFDDPAATEIVEISIP